MTDHERTKIDRIQSLYDDAIARQTEAIRRKCIMEIARLASQMEREINWMQCKQRDAMVREMREIREQRRDETITTCTFYKKDGKCGLPSECYCEHVNGFGYCSANGIPEYDDPV